MLISISARKLRPSRDFSPPSILKLGLLSGAQRLLDHVEAKGRVGEK